MAALDQGQRFYIVRAALNDDEQAAGKFLGWVGSGAATVISNVTVFDKATTLFDFLLATPLGNAELAESLAVLDPARASLNIEMVLDGGRNRKRKARLRQAAGNGGLHPHFRQPGLDAARHP